MIKQCQRLHLKPRFHRFLRFLALGSVTWLMAHFYLHEVRVWHANITLASATLCNGSSFSFSSVKIYFRNPGFLNSLVQQCKLHRFNHMTDPSLITWCQIHHHRGHVIWLWSFRWSLSHVRVGARDRSIRAWNKLSDMDW